MLENGRYQKRVSIKALEACTDQRDFLGVHTIPFEFDKTCQIVNMQNRINMHDMHNMHIEHTRGVCSSGASRLQHQIWGGSWASSSGERHHTTIEHEIVPISIDWLCLAQDMPEFQYVKSVLYV